VGRVGPRPTRVGHGARRRLLRGFLAGGGGVVESGAVLRARFLLLMGAVVALGVAGTACAEQSAAIRVGDDTVSEEDFRDEVEALGKSETALQLMLGATRTDVAGELGDDSFTQPFIGYMVQQRVSLILQEQLAEQNDIELTDAVRDEVRGQIESEFENAGADMDDLPDAFVDQLVDDIAIGQALQSADQGDLQADYLELAENADVELSSHLGEWNNDAFVASLLGQGQDPQGQQISAVTPPSAPQTAPAGGEGTEGTAGTDPGSPAG